MIELGKAKRHSIQELCRESREVLVRGAMEGAMGRVWVPQLENSPYCLIRSGDFAYVLGLPPKGERALNLTTQIYESCGGTFLIKGDELWGGWIEEQLQGHYRMATRYALKRDEHHFDEEVLKEYETLIPEGAVIVKIDGALYHEVLKEDWSRDFCVNFDDEAHFLTDGLGYVAVKDDEIISGCSAYGVSAGMMEIQIRTRKDYRRQGLALACASAFLRDCLTRGVVPNWAPSNQHLVELAEKMGYVYENEYQVYQLEDVINNE